MGLQFLPFLRCFYWSMVNLVTNRKTGNYCRKFFFYIFKFWILLLVCTLILVFFMHYVELNEILAILLSADAYKIDGKICADLVFDIENQEDLSQRHT